MLYKIHLWFSIVTIFIKIIWMCICRWKKSAAFLNCSSVLTFRAPESCRTPKWACRRIRRDPGDECRCIKNKYSGIHNGLQVDLWGQCALKKICLRVTDSIGFSFRGWAFETHNANLENKWHLENRHLHRACGGLRWTSGEFQVTTFLLYWNHDNDINTSSEPSRKNQGDQKRYWQREEPDQ